MPAGQAVFPLPLLQITGEGKILSPAAKSGAVDMLKDALSMSERLACSAGLDK